jgi:hypothetical protein
MALNRIAVVCSLVFMTSCGVEVAPPGAEEGERAAEPGDRSPLEDVDVEALPVHDARELIETPTGELPPPSTGEIAGTRSMVSCFVHADLTGVGHGLAEGMALIWSQGEPDFAREVFETGSDEHGTYSTPCTPLRVEGGRAVSSRAVELPAEVWNCDVSRSTFESTAGVRFEGVPEPTASGPMWFLVAPQPDRWLVVDSFPGSADAIQLRDGRYGVDSVLAAGQEGVVGGVTGEETGVLGGTSPRGPGG